MGSKKHADRTDEGKTGEDQASTETLDRSFAGTEQVRGLRDEHERDTLNTGGAVENPTGVGEEFRQPIYGTDESLPIVGWLIRGMAGCVNMIDSITLASAPTYPAMHDELRAVLEHLANVYAREANRQK